MSETALEMWQKHAQRGAAFEDDGEASKWSAVEEYASAFYLGGTERAIADEAGKSQSHIHFMLITRVIKAQPGNETLSFADCYALAKQKKPKQHEEVENIELPEGVYSTVVIDPPWQYDNRGTRGAANDHYPTMTLGELAALEVPAADEAHLYLWTTNAFLRDAFDLVDKWGFDYKATLVWVKAKGSQDPEETGRPVMGMGNYFRISHELVLFGVRGNLKTRRRDALSWFQAPRGRHSAKPDAFYSLVETCSPGPYLDMFNRDRGKMFRRPGWAGWGNEA